MARSRNLDRAPSRAKTPYPTTPDGRYFVVRGQLWRSSNPALLPEDRDVLVHDLMQARRGVGTAKRKEDRVAEAAARLRVDAAKRSLSERGPVSWSDGAPDLNRRCVSSTPYADWYAVVTADEGDV